MNRGRWPVCAAEARAIEPGPPRLAVEELCGDCGRVHLVVLVLSPVELDALEREAHRAAFEARRALHAADLAAVQAEEKRQIVEAIRRETELEAERDRERRRRQREREAAQERRRYDEWFSRTNAKAEADAYEARARADHKARGERLARELAQAMDLLGLPDGYTSDDVGRALRRFASKHPDRGGDGEAFKRASAAALLARQALEG